jgi:integrin alpha 8
LIFIVIIGEEIYHIYELKNRGPSTIQEAEVYILWPSFDEDKKHLLYLLGVQSEPQDKVTCKPVPNINPLYVKVKKNIFKFSLFNYIFNT